MKKLFIFSIALVAASGVHAQSSWSLGISGASLGNHSYYSGGMADAHANFHHDDFGTGSLGFVARKTLCPHWSFQTGFGFSSIGFNFALAQDYSLLNEDSQWIGASVSSGVVNIPASIIYNTNLNCRNWRWFVGGGFSTVMSGQTSGSTEGTATAEDNTTVSLSTNYHSPAFTRVHGHLMGGIEKVYKRGAMLSFGLMLNGGLSSLATTDVTYTLDGKTYNHTFTNRGNYCGLFINYYFRPWGSKTK
ncbi:MAG TPA: outer membrane beta-barrel protein [Flavobacteriales bacterium]|nr:outer membrane beta-barrel protein [Flavobacteriales bacterium]